MSEVFLGVIAVSTALMALVQIGVMIGAIVAIKRLTDVASRIEQAARPLIAQANDLIADTSEGVAAVRSQVDRVERQVMQLLTRTDQAVHRVQDYLLAPARQGIALAAGARALFGALGAPLSRAFRSTVG